ncbi:helix-turn-helix domain-containing protein [Paenibacillus alvei]|nr:helix-turn-helix domain-containing protein [Paenibacillus alvei]MCY9587490.1 helix-turn-helix domain-containing protein [Paenibacillus alvei]
MDAQGKCFPTQWQIAECLGVKRETASRRISALAKYRWQGKPLILCERRRNPESQSWEHTEYTILPLSGLRIFR